MVVNPQAENGHTDIANEIIEALAKIRISGKSMQVLWFILRKTYGWHKKWDSISLSQFISGTGISKSCVCKAIKKLTDMNIIIVKKGNYGINNYMFNKNYDKWKSLEKKEMIVKKGNSIVKKGNLDCKKRKTTKETLTKETNQKKLVKKTNPEIKVFITYFFDKYLEKQGEKYHVDGGKDGAIVKKLLGTYNINKLKLFCDRYFVSNDKFILEAGYSIGVFKSVINKLVSVSTTKEFAVFHKPPKSIPDLTPEEQKKSDKARHKACEDVKSKMTPAEVAEAKKRVQGFKKGFGS